MIKICFWCSEEVWSDEYLADQRKQVFTRCLVNKLTCLPLQRKYPSGFLGYISVLLKKRKEIEKEVYDVLLEINSLEELYNEAANTWDINKKIFSTMFFECYQHLTSDEAEKVEEKFRIFLNK
jgi:hypothetical protein